MKKNAMSVSIVLIFLAMLFLVSRHEMNERPKRLIGFGNISMTEIEKIELVGSTGGSDGNFRHTLSETECNGLVELLNRVKLGSAVNRNEALSTGAVTYYTLYFTDKDPITISYGKYFYIEGIYYQFLNFDELQEEFIYFNSLGLN